jgi:nicotinamide mononucleotide transporter
MDWIKAIEVFAFATGIIYVILEIFQKNAMWVIGILTGAACAVSFGVQHLWASMLLNIYYVGVSFAGIAEWKKASEETEGHIHLARPGRKTLILSAVVFVAGSSLLIVALKLLGDSESALDAIVTVGSAIGTWWLVKSYPQQWLIWIAADTLSTILCLVSGMHWMALLYVAYTLSAVYGYFHWVRSGRYSGDSTSKP